MTATPHGQHRARGVARYLLAGLLITAGIAHLSFGRRAFRAQVPGWVPIDQDLVVLASGALEIALGTALLAVRSRKIGWVAGFFFVAVFPGNVSQLVNHRDAFGLDSDTRRAIRLLFQPLLVLWAVWSTARRSSRISPD